MVLALHLIWRLDRGQRVLSLIMDNGTKLLSVKIVRNVVTRGTMDLPLQI